MSCEMEFYANCKFVQIYRSLRIFSLNLNKLDFEIIERIYFISNGNGHYQHIYNMVLEYINN